MFPVLFASMPFGLLRSPSLGLSLLQAGLRERGISSRIEYFALEFARRIGEANYREITDYWFTPDLVGEWVFAEALQGKTLEDEAYVRQILEGEHPAHRKTGTLRPKDIPGLVGLLRDLRQEVPAFLEVCLAKVVAAQPRVLALSSVFEQTAATLALARRVKEVLPDTLVVLGGPNAEGEMGRTLFRVYPFLDWVVSGEADFTFPESVEAFLQTGRLPLHQGFLVRDHLAGDPVDISPQGRKGMDDLPIPDFTDFFEQAARTLEGPLELLFESSRGCWWGQKQHCTFCGLNGQSMAFRSKSPDRAHGELKALVDRHPGHPVTVVDNILDMAYFKTLLPRMAAEGPRADLFWEVKANLTRSQLKTLKEAGIRNLQPGIESLSDDALRRMRKGVSALQNLQFLKFGTELGLAPRWSILVGFPGEDPEEVIRMAATLPLLHHLPPPMLATRILLDRFSPNYLEAEARGLVNVQAYPSYGFIHGLPQEDLDGLAYYFAYDYRDGRQVEAYLDPLHDAVEAWRGAAASARLVGLSQAGGLLVFDTRKMAKAPLHFLQGPALALLEGAEGVTALADLMEKVAARFPEAKPQDVLAELEDLGLVLVRGGKVLALPVILRDEAKEQIS